MNCDIVAPPLGFGGVGLFHQFFLWFWLRSTLDPDVSHYFETDASHSRIKNYYDEEPPYGNAEWTDATDPGDFNFIKGRLTAVAYWDKNLSKWGYTYYSYTFDGNIEWVVQDLPGDELGIKKIAYEYDRQGNPTKMSCQTGEEDDIHVWHYYDTLGRLDKVEAGVTDYMPDKVVAEYSYFPSGAVKRKELGNGVQGIDYRYNMRGWLKMINHQNIGTASQDPGGDDDDRFGEIIGYDDYGHIATGGGFDAEKRYNGDISWSISSSYGQNPQTIGYTYNYDFSSRLQQANFGFWGSSQWNDQPALGYDVRDIGYDANGNLQSLKRYDENGGVDNLQYQYYNNSNKLRNVTDDFMDTFTYDANGNLVGDTDRGMAVQYDFRNLPYQMILPNSTLKMGYDANGNRITKSFITE